MYYGRGSMHDTTRTPGPTPHLTSPLLRLRNELSSSCVPRPRHDARVVAVSSWRSVRSEVRERSGTRPQRASRIHPTTHCRSRRVSRTRCSTSPDMKRASVPAQQPQKEAPTQEHVAAAFSSSQSSSNQLTSRGQPDCRKAAAVAARRAIAAKEGNGSKRGQWQIDHRIESAPPFGRTSSTCWARRGCAMP